MPKRQSALYELLTPSHCQETVMHVDSLGGINDTRLDRYLKEGHVHVCQQEVGPYRQSVRVGNASKLWLGPMVAHVNVIRDGSARDEVHIYGEIGDDLGADYLNDGMYLRVHPMPRPEHPDYPEVEAAGIRNVGQVASADDPQLPMTRVFHSPHGGVVIGDALFVRGIQVDLSNPLSLQLVVPDYMPVIGVGVIGAIGINSTVRGVRDEVVDGALCFMVNL